MIFIIYGIIKKIFRYQCSGPLIPSFPFLIRNRDLHILIHHGKEYQRSRLNIR